MSTQTVEPDLHQGAQGQMELPEAHQVELRQSRQRALGPARPAPKDARQPAPTETAAEQQVPKGEGCFSEEP